MAVGDAFALFLGTGSVVYQPSSGVEQQLTTVVKVGTTDNFSSYDGSAENRMIAAGEETHVANQAATAIGGGWNQYQVLAVVVRAREASDHCSGRDGYRADWQQLRNHTPVWTLGGGRP